MEGKLTKIVSIITAVLFVIFIILSRVLMVSLDVDALLFFYQILMLGLVPAVDLVGNFILSFSRSKLFFVYSIATAIVSYLIPFFAGMYSGEFIFVPLTLVIALAPVVVGLVIGLVASIIRDRIRN